MRDATLMIALVTAVALFGVYALAVYVDAVEKTPETAPVDDDNPTEKPAP